MSITATPPASLSLLVPASVLPSEAEEIPALLADDTSLFTSLFDKYQKLALSRAPRFFLTSSDVTFEGNLDEESLLRYLDFTANEEGSPQLEPRMAMSYFDWAGVVREIGHSMLDEHFLGTKEEVVRVFIEAVREVSGIASLGFVGEPVPLLVVRKRGDAIEVSFLGIWLGNDDQMDDLRCHLPVRAWQDGSDVGQTTCVLLDAAEVEGRGLKEAAMSAAILAMVFGAGGTASAGQGSPQRSTSVLASLFGSSKDSQKGEKLPVKSQRLTQEAPRIYRDVLDEESSDLRVIVNIGAQRAYIVKDGRIAFDTPISSAATGHRTPRGEFTISEKVRSGKMSTIYKCPLPGWMRLGETAVGMHQGDLPGYPASHGCIRMPLESAMFIFDHVKVGTPVEVVDSWTPTAHSQAQTKLVAQN